MRSRHCAHAILAVALLVALSGCFTADATLEANGSGTMDLEYIPAPNATLDSERARFTSPHVTVRDLVPRQVGAFLQVSFDDVTKLSTAAGFEILTVRRDRKHGEERLRLMIRNQTPKELPDDARPGPRITVTLPGRVLAANQDSEASGRRVSWRLPLRDWARRPRVILSVRYAVS
jgi:hypothetical protein